MAPSRGSFISKKYENGWYRQKKGPVRWRAQDRDEHQVGRTVNGIPVLPRPANPLETFEVRLRAQSTARSAEVDILVCRHNLYMSRFKRTGDQQRRFELLNESRVAFVADSSLLHFGESYVSMDLEAGRTKIGYQKLIDAIRFMACHEVGMGESNIRSSTEVVALMVPEASRFPNIEDICADLLENEDNVVVESHFVDLIHFWGNFSTYCLEEDESEEPLSFDVVQDNVPLHLGLSRVADCKEHVNIILASN